MSRIKWDEYFFKIVDIVKMRSTCKSRQVGSVLVRDNRILATGYNGAVIGSKHCSEIDEKCLRKQLNIPSGQRHEICRGVHAEQNVIIQCAKYGIQSKDSILYCNISPCSICLKMLINCEIKIIKFEEFYPDELLFDICKESGYIIIKNNEIRKDG